MVKLRDEELEADAAFSSSLVRTEYEALLGSFQEALSKADPDKDGLALLAETMAEKMAVISARLAMLEIILTDANQNATHVAAGLLARTANGTSTAGTATERNSTPAQPGVLMAARQLTHMPNFYNLEGQQDELEYCWSGPQPVSRFLLHLARDKTSHLSLHVVAFADPGTKETVAVRIDSQVVEHKWRKMQGGFVLEFSVPPLDQASSKKTLVVVELSKTFCPAEHGASTDIRQLGMAISSLSLL